MEKSETTAKDYFASPRYGAKPERTFGLKAFDVWLYPGITNTGVFATSVFFTFLTNRGGSFGKAGSNARAFGELVEKRGTWLRGKFMDMGMSEGVANNAKMVFWSFADGTLLAPVIKGFEDNRENIARSIDSFAGTTPDDESVYASEPKQTWRSVLGARLLTAGIVAPTAAALNKVNITYAGEVNNVNHHLFTRPGMWLGRQLRERESLVQRYGKDNIEEVANCTFFEAFYTSVCTAGQYYFSRFIAERDEMRPDTRVEEITAQPAQQLQAQR